MSFIREFKIIRDELRPEFRQPRQSLFYLKTNCKEGLIERKKECRDSLVMNKRDEELERCLKICWLKRQRGCYSPIAKRREPVYDFEQRERECFIMKAAFQ